MAITSGLVISRLIGSPLTRSIARAGQGGEAVADPDEGYLLESGGADAYLLEAGVETDSYLLEGAWLCTEDSAIGPNETIIQGEQGPFIELEQGDLVNLLDEANGDKMLSEQSTTRLISGEQNG